MSGSSQYRFGVLAKIVKHMKNRHCKSMKRLSFTKLITIPVSAAGDDHPLTIEEILDETNQLDIGSSVKNVIHHFTYHCTTLTLVCPFSGWPMKHW